MNPPGAGSAHANVRFPPPLLFAGAFFIGWLLHRALPIPLLGASVTAVRLIIGWLAAALGFTTTMSGIITFRRAGTTVIPHHPVSRVVTHGPYRFTRNPMYLGLTIAYIGGILLMNDLWPAVLLPVALLLLIRFVIEREERYLSAAFGTEYDEYRRRVRRWI